MKKIILSFLFNYCLIGYSQKSEIFIKNNKAIDGYDVVSLLKNGKIEKGTDENIYLWQNANWSFKNKENLDSFISNPAKYIPQYGGYCAFGCSKGYKASTEIETWTIVDGKLYFNYNLKVKENWLKNKEAFIKTANENWLEIKNKS